MDWASVVPTAGVVLLLCAILPIVWLYARRRWLARSGGLFDCELNIGTDTKPHWVLGLVRYSGERLEWFRVLALGLRPEHILHRTAGQRIDARVQAVTAGAAQRLVRLESHTASGDTIWDLAMEADAATGLLAWLEAAPPSVGRFRS